MSNSVYSRADLIQAAKSGRWWEIKLHLHPSDIVQADIDWAMQQRIELADELRRLAAQYLLVSSLRLDDYDKVIVRGWMLAEHYEPAKHLLTMALYKRGMRGLEVTVAMEAACRDTEVGNMALMIKQTA